MYFRTLLCCCGGGCGCYFLEKLHLLWLVQTFSITSDVYVLAVAIPPPKNPEAILAMMAIAKLTLNPNTSWQAATPTIVKIITARLPNLSAANAKNKHPGM